MSLETRLQRLERAPQSGELPYDLTLLTDAELLALEECFSKAEARGLPLAQYITPEVDAALQRVERHA